MIVVCTDSSVSGLETWIFGEPLDPSLVNVAIDENGGGALGQTLTQEAQNFYRGIVNDIVREEQLRLSKQLADSIHQELVAGTQSRDRGVRENYFYVIRNAQIPAVLVEVGFLSHGEEGRLLSSTPYQETIAASLAKGIIEFLQPTATF